jgi:hypothetical protein
VGTEEDDGPDPAGSPSDAPLEEDELEGSGSPAVESAAVCPEEDDGVSTSDSDAPPEEDEDDGPGSAADESDSNALHARTTALSAKADRRDGRALASLTSITLKR